MRYAVNPIILLSNNGSYTIESEIHDGWAAAAWTCRGCVRIRRLAGAPWAGCPAGPLNPRPRRTLSFPLSLVVCCLQAPR